MSLQQIRTAVMAGKTVHWKTVSYTVVCRGEWFIQCDNGHCIGLTWADGETLNANPESFYVAE